MKALSNAIVKGEILARPGLQDRVGGQGPKQVGPEVGGEVAELARNLPPARFAREIVEGSTRATPRQFPRRQESNSPQHFRESPVSTDVFAR